MYSAEASPSANDSLPYGGFQDASIPPVQNCFQPLPCGTAIANLSDTDLYVENFSAMSEQLLSASPLDQAVQERQGRDLVDLGARPVREYGVDCGPLELDVAPGPSAAPRPAGEHLLQEPAVVHRAQARPGPAVLGYAHEEHHHHVPDVPRGEPEVFVYVEPLRVGLAPLDPCLHVHGAGKAVELEHAVGQGVGGFRRDGLPRLQRCSQAPVLAAPPARREQPLQHLPPDACPG